jgi:hypothetical protein
VRLASQLGIELVAATNAKIDRNEQRYPAEEFRGSARKCGEG